MRRPTESKRLYIDFDGFFASCEEQADPGLHGRPVGVIPFAGARNSCVIAANAAAKRFGVKTGTSIAEARRLCPRIALPPQRPDLYVRIHQRIIAAVLSVLPIDVVCSIDECAAVLGGRDRPEEIAGRIKSRVRAAVGERITCSIGCAPNRWLAKIAADLEKPDGLTVLLPGDLPGPLLRLGLEALPGVGKSHTRAFEAGRDSHDRGGLEHQPRTAAFGLGQRGRRALLVRAPRLRRGTTGDEARLDRPRPGPASGGAQRALRPADGQATGGEGGPAPAPGGVPRPEAHPVGRLPRCALLDGLDARRKSERRSDLPRRPLGALDRSRQGAGPGRPVPGHRVVRPPRPLG